jgi:hypothetical protein
MGNATAIAASQADLPQRAYRPRRLVEQAKVKQKIEDEGFEDERFKDHESAETN